MAPSASKSTPAGPIPATRRPYPRHSMTLDPSSEARGLVNLAAELEHRLTGASVSPRLAPDLAGQIPEADTYVLVLFDGLGMAQLGHPAAGSLPAASRGALQAPFPTTTSVSLATLATATPPSRHGLIAHLSWLEELGLVVNTLKWVDLTGAPVRFDYASLLPRPNLWERLRIAGVEPITVQPHQFAGSPLSRLLYRGARFEGTWDVSDLVSATVQLASRPGRFIFTYVWEVDFAAHVHGLDSPQFAEAVTLAARVWDGLVQRLPPGAALVGTADHGLVQVREEDKLLIREPRLLDLRYAGDPRGLRVWGEPSLVSELAQSTGATVIDRMAMLGPDPIEAVRARAGDAVLLAPEGKVLLPPGFDRRLVCYHGGIHPAEQEIPLLVG